MTEKKYLLVGDAVAKVEATKKEMALVIKATNAKEIDKKEYEKRLKEINDSQKQL